MCLFSSKTEPATLAIKQTRNKTITTKPQIQKPKNCSREPKEEEGSDESRAGWGRVGFKTQSLLAPKESEIGRNGTNSKPEKKIT